MRAAFVSLVTGSWCLLPVNVGAGGSGLNVAVVVNQYSADSVELGNYYCEQRGIPPENLVRINWSGGNTTWTLAQFESQLFNPLQAAIADRDLGDQIRYVVLSMDIPFAVSGGNVVNSTTSSLFYGFKSGTKDNKNSYAHSEGAFGEVLPDTAPGPSFLATMITAGSLEQARKLVTQGVGSDGTFPTQTVFLARSSDPLRNIRHRQFDDAIFSSRLTGYDTVQRVDSDVVAGRADLLGFQTGLANFSISPNTFVPGAMADSMTSFAGVIFGPNSQTSLLAFIHAGASGSYGAVTEPGAVASKFPDPLVYFYQARGFSLAECYYQGLEYPYQGLIVAEPLAAPYQRAATGAWIGLSSNTVLSSRVPLSVQFEAADLDRPLQQVDLFIDGRFFQTLTNLTPQAGNELLLNFVGGTVRYTVPANATLTSLAKGLADSINSVAASSPANITARAHGDRIEVQSRSGDRPPPSGGLRIGSASLPPVAGGKLLAESSRGAAGLLTTFLSTSRESSLESSALGGRAGVLSGSPQTGSWLRLSVTRTDGAPISVGVTNQSAGVRLFELADEMAALVNSAPGLQGARGLRMEELTADASTVVTFTLRPRTSGYAAAGLKFALTASSGLTFTVAANDLRENLNDLLPRNHIYVRAGATSLDIDFPLDTTLLEDGYHELTAVAYEGSHVRTQAKATVPVHVQNRVLGATLTLPSVPDPAPADGRYAVEVAANQAGVTAIHLFSTGGALDTITGQSSATFTLDGVTLGAGLHPVYAIVEGSGGGRYRTDPHWLRLTANP